MRGCRNARSHPGDCLPSPRRGVQAPHPPLSPLRGARANNLLGAHFRLAQMTALVLAPILAGCEEPVSVAVALMQETLGYEDPYLYDDYYTGDLAYAGLA